jgi:predicted DNA-binding protein (UPF0251 family)
LHAVAYRVACEARSTAARRFKHEQTAAMLATEARRDEGSPHAELEVQLQAEIARLTERHRRAIVLCDLQGLTHEEAARLLGTPVGTIKSRLARGREQLRERLSRRGLGVPESALSVALAGEAFKFELPSAVIDRTARVAMLVAGQTVLKAGAVPASVASLVSGVLKSMVRSRLKIAAAAIATTAGIALCIAFAARGLLARAETVRRPSSPPPVSQSDSGVRDLIGSTGLVRSVTYSRDGRFLIGAFAPGDDDKSPGVIRLWDARGFKSHPPLELDGDPFAMAVTPDSKAIAVAIARGEAEVRTLHIRIVAVPSCETKKEWALTKGIDVWALAFAPDGKTLLGGIGGLREGRFFGEVRIWDSSSGEVCQTLTGHPNPVMSLAFSHDGRTLASASGTYGASSGEVRLWDVDSRRLLRTLTEADLAIVTVSFSPDDRTVASGGTIWGEGNVSGGIVRLWDVATGDKRLTLPAFPSYVHAVSFAPKGAVLATASVGPDGDARVALWDPNTGKAIRTLPTTENIQRTTAVKCAVFSPDGQVLAAGGAAGMLRLWRVHAGD